MPAPAIADDLRPMHPIGKLSRLGCNSCALFRSSTMVHGFAAISASFATVFMLRAVPVFAAGIFSFERPIPLG
jgi:hypothetical protein